MSEESSSLREPDDAMARRSGAVSEDVQPLTTDEDAEKTARVRRRGQPGLKEPTHPTASRPTNPPMDHPAGDVAVAADGRRDGAAASCEQHHQGQWERADLPGPCSTWWEHEVVAVVHVARRSRRRSRLNLRQATAPRSSPQQPRRRHHPGSARTSHYRSAVEAAIITSSRAGLAALPFRFDGRFYHRTAGATITRSMQGRQCGYPRDPDRPEQDASGGTEHGSQPLAPGHSAGAALRAGGRGRSRDA